jgi:hypothetical protein
MADIEQGIRGYNFNKGPGFFDCFALGSLRNGFAVFQIASRQGPFAGARLNGPPAEQNVSMHFRYASDHYLGVLVMDDSAGFTKVTGAVITGRHFQPYPIAAVAAVVHHPISR